ncbi:MAG: 3-keto-5-aminohexanoate cleavage protein [Hyphomonadaceae bacterium]
MGDGNMNQILISVAPNGARKTAKDHPTLPITAEEIAATAAACADAGAGLLHMHVRDASGGHSLDPARYREATAAVREAVGDRLIVQITTESVGLFDIEDQIRTVEEVRPEACSVALRELCPTDENSDVVRYRAFLGDCSLEGVWVQHILYDLPDISRFNRLRREGVYGEQAFVLLVVGRYAKNHMAEPLTLARMAAALGDGGNNAPDWAACGFGQDETRILAGAAALGGHVRVGFENNLLHVDGEVAASNAERVAAISNCIADLGLAPMSARDARRTLIAQG